MVNLFVVQRAYIVLFDAGTVTLVTLFPPVAASYHPLYVYPGLLAVGNALIVVLYWYSSVILNIDIFIELNVVVLSSLPTNTFFVPVPVILDNGFVIDIFTFVPVAVSVYVFVAAFHWYTAVISVFAGIVVVDLLSNVPFPIYILSLLSVVTSKAKFLVVSLYALNTAYLFPSSAILNLASTLKFLSQLYLYPVFNALAPEYV